MTIENKQKLAEALLQYRVERMKYLPDPSECSVTFSPQFERNMAKLIRKQRKPYYYFMNTIQKKIAIAAAIIIIIFTTTAFASEYARTKIHEFWVDTFPQFSVVSVEENRAVPTKILDEYLPRYIPEGYSISSDSKTDVSYSIVYQADNDVLVFEQLTKESFIPVIDTESVPITEIILNNGLSGFYCSNKDVNILVLHNDEYSFLLTSQISIDELIKIGESIKK